MDKEITLALLTPRSGELNYRYLVPEGVSYNDMRLGEIRNRLERSEKDRPGLLFQCDVRQVGGRTGTESLMLFLPDFGNYSESEQTLCRQTLQNWFDNQREPMIQSIDWSKESTASMIPRPELTALLKEIQTVLSNPVPKLQKNDLSQTEKRTISYSCLIIIMLTIVLAAIVTYSALDYFLPEIWQNPPFWGENHNSKPQQLPMEQQIAPYLPLFKFSGDKPDLKELEDAFDEVFYNCEGKGKDYREDDDVNRVMQQMTTNTPVFGSINDNPEKEQMLKNVQGISPEQLRRLLLVYNDLQRTVGSKSESILFVRLLQVECHFDFPNLNSYKKLTNEPIPLFYIEKGKCTELTWAKNVHKFMVEITTDFISDRIEESKEGNRKSLSKKAIVELCQMKQFKSAIEACKEQFKDDEDSKEVVDEFYAVLATIIKENSKQDTANPKLEK